MHTRAATSALEVPSQSLILGAVFTRSLLFLFATIPILMNWSRSRKSLIFGLGAALAAAWSASQR